MSIGERLRYARERIGLTLSKVAEKVDIGVSSLSEFENGKREPSMRQLQALSKLYRRPISFFFSEGEIASEIVLWRQQPEKSTRQELEDTFVTLCEQYHNLESWCGDIFPCRLPAIRSEHEGFGYPDAENLAYEVRKTLQLGDYPAPALLRILEEVCGIKVFHLAFDPSGCAACTVSGTFGMAILLNKKNVRWRRNFDLAHELFHLLTWKIFRKTIPSDLTLPGEKEEQLANIFASNLLMPEEVLKNAFDFLVRNNTIAFSSLSDIARQFDVSIEALIWRLTSLRRLDRKHAEEVIDRYKTPYTIYEKRKDEEPPERPERYVALALKALRTGEISIGRFAEYLGISRREASSYIEQEFNENEEIAVVAP
ncbi:MAG: helix-turn-helix domain-containing protein [bacterium]